MPIGALVRKSFGRHEHWGAELYRGLFLDLRDYVAKITHEAPAATRVLEVGCGEGAVTEILAAEYPEAEILAIDITPRLGRLYRGRPDGIQFREISVQQIAVEQPGRFDLITLSDVVHHIPPGMRAEIFDAISRCLAPGGRFVPKDWGRAATPTHWLCHAGDRWLTGDRVAYLTQEEAVALVTASAPDLRLVARTFIRPWPNNYVLTFQC